MTFYVGVAGRKIPVNDLCIAANTYLGNGKTPDAKDSYVILTDLRIYVGPDLSECRRMLNARADKSTMHFAGKCPSNVKENLGYLVEGILAQAIFGG